MAVKMFNFSRNNSPKQRLSRMLTRVRGNYPRRFPDFFVAGATRSGTGALYDCLAEHQSIFMPKDKELHYFDNDALFELGALNYQYFFGGYDGEKYIGEATPHYWESGSLEDKRGVRYHSDAQDAISRIYSVIPNAKFIISLRDPLTRIRSIYLKNFWQGKIDHSLEKELELERRGKSVLKLIERSQYQSNFDNLFKYFSKDNVHVALFEEWTCDNGKGICSMLEFIGCEDTCNVRLLKSNSGLRYQKLSKNRIAFAELSSITKSEIVKETRIAREYVQDLLGKKVPWKTK